MTRIVETLLVATRAGGPDDPPPEAEPVLVETTDVVVRLVLDDGTRLEFDAVEFSAATRPRAA